MNSKPKDDERDEPPITRAEIEGWAAGRRSPPLGQLVVASRPPRNGPCPCGAKKKFKHCCGAAS